LLSYQVQEPSFRPKLLTFFVSSEVEKSASLPSHPHPNRAATVAFASAVAAFSVILNAVKDPEEFHLPPTLEHFNPYLPAVVVAVVLAFALGLFLPPPLAFLPSPRTVISTEAAHAFCEQRSGEICCSSSAREKKSSNSAQKSHVKPQNHLNPSNKRK
jgi:hypothetical protein